MKRNKIHLLVLYTGLILSFLTNFSCNSKNNKDRKLSEDKNSSPKQEQSSRQEEVVKGPLEIMIGQMIMVGFKGTDPPDRESKGSRWFQILDRQICDGQVGGVLILDYNIIDKEQTLKLTNYFNNAPGPYPLFIAVDQEGGTVQRLSARKGFTWFPSAREAAANTQEEALALYRSMAAELADYGINMNLGPVVDLELDRSSPAIGALGRSFSAKPPVVISYARQFINAHRQFNIITVLKHFPGHGSAAHDSHRGLTDVTSLWQEKELIPYEVLIATDHVDAVMTAHVFNANVDPHNPASLSAGHIENVLRRKMEYEGLIITDDLQMKAVSKFYTFEERVIMAVQAGSDVLLFANSFSPDVNIPVKAAQVLKKAVQEGIISEERIVRSYQRITAIKKRKHSVVRMLSNQ